MMHLMSIHNVFMGFGLCLLEALWPSWPDIFILLVVYKKSF